MAIIPDCRTIFMRRDSSVVSSLFIFAQQAISPASKEQPYDRARVFPEEAARLSGFVPTAAA